MHPVETIFEELSWTCMLGEECVLELHFHNLQQMKTIMERLPPYQFLIAFSQLISRICHPNSDVFAQLEVCTYVTRPEKIGSQFSVQQL